MSRKAEDMEWQEKLAGLSGEQRALLALRLARRAAEGSQGEPRSPTIPVRPGERHEAFPLTDLQEAYWLGRSGAFEMGDVASHSYVEIDGHALDLPRAERALQRVIDRHDMLRAVILPDGRQRVLESVEPYAIEALDLRQRDPEDVRRRLERVRGEMSHRILPSDRWPLFEVRAALLPEGKTRLFIGLDALIFDAWSARVFLGEWARFYAEPDWAPDPLSLAFRDHVLAVQAERASEAFSEARRYWESRVDELPPAPRLPAAIDHDEARPRFVRRQACLSPEAWGHVKTRAAAIGISEAAALLAAYAEVLSIWSGSPRFTVSVPQFNRPPWHPEINDVIGEFASFVLLEVDNRGSDSFAARARRHQERLWEDLDHSRFTGVRVLRELARRRGETGGVLMPVVFTSLPAEPAEAEGTPWAALGEVVYVNNQSSQVWLDNHVYEKDGALLCDWDTVDARFPPGLPQRMLDAFVDLLRLLGADAEMWEASRSEITGRLLGDELEARDLFQGRVEPVPDLRAHDPFLKRAAEDPRATAVVAPDRTLSYGELLGLANLWGHRLRGLGARPNEPVAIVMEKGWEQIVAVLGILQSGAPYLPIDADEPIVRLHQVLESGRVKLVLTQQHLKRRLAWPVGVRCLCVAGDEPGEEGGTAAESCPSAAQGTEDLAYVLFTSGSTGDPKGVKIGHRGLLNAIQATNREFGIGRRDSVLALTALHHDMSAYDILGVLAAGGAIVVPEASRRREPEHWLELLVGREVTLWNSVPAMMEMMLEFAAGRSEACVPSLRRVFLGGDWISLSLPERLRAVAPNARLVSVGGPTETTLWNIWYPVDAVDGAWRSIPYGRPIANTRYHILSAELDDCPTWVTGEMCVSGVGLAQGYWDDEDLTGEKFVVHPRTGQRIYRTGDLGRFLPDGNIEILGRIDSQVKVRGHRIEPGEVEAALRSHARVREAVVVPVGERGEKRELAAYVVGEDGSLPSPEELRAFLAERLPRHMIPAQLVPLDHLPLTRNGKIDRRSLPDPAVATAPTERPAAAATETSEAARKILGIVETVLDVERVDPLSNLLEYGANSIDMVRIGNQLEEAFGTRPRIEELFRLQSVAELIDYFETGEADPIPRAGATLGSAAPLAGSGGERRDVDAIIASFRTLHGPEEREEFKRSQPGIRGDLESEPFVELVRPDACVTYAADYATRRSRRHFSLMPIEFERFGRFLSCLAEGSLHGEPKYLYASPGGLYATQVYLHIKPGRVEEVSGGTYYYHPVHHRLVSLTPNAVLDREIHIPFINTPIFDEAAFSLFLVAELAAIAPSYGRHSVRFVTLEAGIMAHLLETGAPPEGIGLCQIGSVDFERVAPLLKLRESHLLVHSLLGGRCPAGGQQPSESAGREEKAHIERALERIGELSAEQVEGLLRARREATEEDGRA
ncbi:MAG: amino acid adenylation domain-containing protein [Gemmatimonadota bacterium]